ncbi:MAG: phosphate ABC transporter permease PstA, partial [bacterium]
RTLTGRIAEREPVPGLAGQFRIKLNVANRDLYGADFVWVDDAQITTRAYPSDVAVIERAEWGPLIGTVQALREGGRVVTSGAQAWPEIKRRLPEAARIRREIRRIETGDIGAINHAQEGVRLRLRRLELRGVTTGPEVETLRRETAALQERYKTQEQRLAELRARQTATVLVAADGGKEKDLPLTQVIDVWFPNEMGVLAKTGHYVAQVWAFVSDDPRESNTEGGVFPAIFGTVMMVLIMSIAVVPLGVLTAIYMREYAKQGTFVRTLRIAVNNLAGVPSIVFGIFGLGFFVYVIGGSIDQLFYPEALPTPRFGTGGILWAALTLALLTVPVVIVTTEEGLAAVPHAMREASLALGATKFETLWRVLIPSASPAILTGLILAMARAAGEVAPLMITGVVKLAPSLPLDGHFPYLHLERKFMHLGFHIYDVGFQSPNVEASLPMVYATTLLLILIVLVLNLTAILLRNRLRRRFAAGQF